MSGVWLLRSRSLQSALWSSSIFAIRVCPLEEAICSGLSHLATLLQLSLILLDASEDGFSLIESRLDSM
jgi:hypothetical protein